MKNQIPKIHLAWGAVILLGAAMGPLQAFAAEEKESATMGQGITDTAISTKIRAKLAADKRITDSDVDVNTTNGLVILSGEAATFAIKTAAGSIAKGTEGVVSVDNKLKVASSATLGEKTGDTANRVGESVEHAADKTGEVLTNSYITSKVKSTLLAAKGVTSAGISVETTNGVVALSGHVPSATQQRRAVALTKKIKGVKSVEYKNLEVAAVN